MTLYGWELTERNDTLTYRAAGHFTSEKNVTFDNYEFSRTLPSEISLSEFSVDTAGSIPTILLHRHFTIVGQDENKLEVIATKDVYDSNADKFVFIKRR